MSQQDFEIVPPAKLATVFVAMIAILPPIITLAALALGARGHQASMPYPQIAAALLLFPVSGAVLAWSMHRRRIQVVDGRLAFGLLPWRRIPLGALDLDAARIVDLATQPELQPSMKIAGSGLPGYRSGLFRLRNKVRAQVLLTDWQRVLVLPKRNGSMVLLSPQRPDALLAALRQASHRAGDSTRDAG